MNRLLMMLALIILLFSWQLPIVMAAGDPIAEVKALMEKASVKIQAGANTEQQLAPEIAELDKLIKAHLNEKTDEAAELVMVKVMLYLQVLHDCEKALVALDKLKLNFPQSTQAAQVDSIIAQIRQMEKAKKNIRCAGPWRHVPRFQRSGSDRETALSFQLSRQDRADRFLGNLVRSLSR